MSGPNFRLMVRNMRKLHERERLALIGEQAIATAAAVSTMTKAKRAHWKALSDFRAEHGPEVWAGDFHDEKLHAAKKARDEATATARRERARLRAAINHHLKESA
jgi:hypothetical protein